MDIDIIGKFKSLSPASALGVVVGGAPCCAPTWVERAKNNPVLKKIE